MLYSAKQLSFASDNTDQQKDGWSRAGNLGAPLFAEQVSVRAIRLFRLNNKAKVYEVLALQGLQITILVQGLWVCQRI